jgi:hypothetical protein
MLSIYLIGIEREYSLDRHRPNSEQWIRQIYQFPNSSNFIIVCCTTIQAEEFMKCQHLEIDMSFKMVAGQTNLFSLVAWDEGWKRMYCIY